MKTCKYTLHHETEDGTCQSAFMSYPTKAAAIRVAKLVAKEEAYGMFVRILVCKDEITIASFKVCQ